MYYLVITLCLGTATATPICENHIVDYNLTLTDCMKRTNDFMGLPKEVMPSIGCRLETTKK